MPPLLRLTEADLSPLTLEDARQRVAAAHEHNIREAIEDSCSFVEFALPDEETQLPVEAAELHREWHAHINTHSRANILAPVEHGKTSQIAIGYPLWKLGNNPNLRIALISNTSTQAEKLLAAIRGHIERNRLLHEVFPTLKPSTQQEAVWGQTAITVERTGIIRDPSIQALGVGGAIVGARLDLIILDDVLDFENTRTAEQCQKLIEWFETSVLTRVTARGQIIVIGTPWNPLDFLAHLQKLKGWASKVYCAVSNPDDSPLMWKPIWPQRWTAARLIERFNTTQPLTFYRKYFCRIRDDQSSRFRIEWIDGSKKLGRGRTLLERQPRVWPSGRLLPCFTGVDLGMSPRKKKNANVDLGHGLTVIFTLAVDERARRIPVQIESGRWTSPEILSRLQSTYQRFHSQISVENNGAQEFLVQWAQTRSIPVLPFTTGSNKTDETYGVESLAVELRSGLWLIPSGEDGESLDEETKAWTGEMLAYTPHGHTGDRLMASWFAREGARSLITDITARIQTQDR